MIEPLIEASARSPRHLEVDVVEELDAVRGASERVDHVDDDGVLGARVRRDVRLILVLELFLEARRAFTERAVVVLTARHRDGDAGTLPGAARRDVATRRLERETVVD